MDDSMLRVAALTCRFGGIAALDSVSLDVAAGATVGVVGPNGAGKSTLLSVLGGQTTAQRGTITLGGERIEHLPAHRRFARGLVRTFQLPRPFRRLTVLENLLIVPPQRAGAAARDRAGNLLAAFRLDTAAGMPAGNLSGGQQKLLDIARALMADPRLLLLDEPCAGVSPALIEILSASLDRLRRPGLATVIVEHDFDFLERHCDKVVVMTAGAILASGPPTVIRSNPAVQDAFLGTAGA